MEKFKLKKLSSSPDKVTAPLKASKCSKMDKSPPNCLLVLQRVEMKNMLLANVQIQIFGTDIDHAKESAFKPFNHYPKENN
jgi:hypothetical protein